MLLTSCRVLLTTQTQKLSFFSNLSGHCLRFLLFLHCSLHLQPHTHTSHSRPAVFRPPGSEPPKKLQIKMWFPDHIPDPLIGTLDGRVRNLYVHSTPPTPPSYLRTIAQPENNTCGFRKILPFHLWFITIPIAWLNPLNPLFSILVELGNVISYWHDQLREMSF